IAISLSCYQTTTILPNPKFSDSESLVKNIVRKYSMNGKRYVYIKNNESRRRLLMSFRLTEQKYLELREFLKSYYYCEIILRDHNNVSWRGYFTINPFDFESISRDNESTITLEFEGVKL